MFLIINEYNHHKNKEGLHAILNYLKIDYKYGTRDDIDDADIIYSPSFNIDVKKYKNKKFIFGPHFSVFPDTKLDLINFKSNYHKFIHPSQWTIDLWKKYFNIYIDIFPFPFPVNTIKFNQIKEKREKVIVYFKTRKETELLFILNYLKSQNVDYKIFSYDHKYNEEDFLNYLHECKYGIIIGRHESQGFAIEEMLSCNVPLLIWNVKFMSQEEGCNYPDYEATVIPYWDNRCGEYFYNANEFIYKYNYFINNLENYRPREYILENLSVEICSKRFKDIFLY